MLETTADISPKLRSDLVISRQIISDAPVYVVKDPATDRYFRFREIEGYILNHLDGKTELEALRKKVEAEFVAALPRTTLDSFLTKLRNLKLVEENGHAPQPIGAQRSR